MSQTIPWPRRQLATSHVLLLALPLLAISLLAVDHFLPPPISAASAQFQTIVAGLGLGPATNLSHGAELFDPRLAAANFHADGPIVAGDWFSTARTMSVFPWQQNARSSGNEEANAELR